MKFIDNEMLRSIECILSKAILFESICSEIVEWIQRNVC